MSTDPKSTDANAPVARDIPTWVVPTAVIGICVLALLAFWTLFIEAYSFGAPPGLPPSGQIQQVPLVQSIDQGLQHAPYLGGWAHQFLRWEGNAGNQEQGPQRVWRWYIMWFGVILMGTAFLMLFVKRFVEPTNEETTVMHLKGDTDVSHRAKGFRG